MAALLGILATSSCSEPVAGPTPSGDVVAFLASQNLPKQQPVELLLDVPEEGVQLFKVSYGDSAHYTDCCPPTVYFPTAVGLRVNANVGWIVAFDGALEATFDVTPADAYLATDEFFVKAESAHPWSYRYRLKPLLAADPDTPIDGLVRLARQLTSLRPQPSPQVARNLLANPTARTNRDLIYSLTFLDVRTYTVERAHAIALLDSLYPH